MLKTLIDEARQELGTREARSVDWDAVDAKLFDRIEQERRLEVTRSANMVRPTSAAWGVGAAVLAAAACLALVVGKTHSASSLEAPVVAAAVPPAGNVAAILGSGDLLVDGKPAPVGATLRLGNVIETRGVSVTVDRPGKLTMVLEAGTHATVTHVQGALVLALETGAVEAQVVPVASGEAFAVDVAGSRVAVHGTHLRVERAAEHVNVDLNEGVVVVGAAPREGSTTGTLVTAPAHASFDDQSLEGTLSVSHEASSVRAPVALTPSPAAQPVPVALLVPPPARTAEPRAMIPGTAPVVRPAPVAPAASAAPVAAVPGPDPNAASTLTSAVRSCMAARQSAENVTVVVNTTLHVELDDSGNTRSARFDPPVAPDVNTCAAAVIYRTRWTHGGSADVPIDFKVPPVAP